MHNDFIIVGPKSDPAGIKGSTSASDAFKKVATAEAVFLSRGDQSGTNTKELALWTSAGIQPSGTWYQETGSGMGATLNVTNEKQGYTLSDRGTYLAQKKNLDLDLLVEGDKALFNQYHVMVVDPKKHSNVNAEGARAFASWITSPEIQKTIGEFGVKDYGQQLFIPDAAKEAAGATPTSAATP